MKSLLVLVMLLGICGVAHAEKTIDELESDDYGFALNCNGTVVSSVRYNWGKVHGAKLATTSSLFEAQKYMMSWAYSAPPVDFRTPIKTMQEGTDWRPNLQIVNENLGLPEKIDGCDVEVVWVNYGKFNNGPTNIIGRQEYWNKLNFTDLYLLFLSREARLSTSGAGTGSRLQQY